MCIWFFLRQLRYLGRVTFSIVLNDEAKDKIDSLKKNEIVYTDVQSNGTEKKVPTGVTMETLLIRRPRQQYGIMRTQQTVDSESHIMEQRSAWILQSMVQMEHI